MSLQAQPRDGVARMAALDDLHPPDKSADPVLDSLVRSAAAMLGCSMASISVVDRDHEWCMAQFGMGSTSAARSPSPGRSLRNLALVDTPLLVVEDAAADPRFAELFANEPGARFHAVAPLVVNGQVVGTFCVFDREPRSLDPAQRALLLDLAHAAEHWIVSWRAQHRLHETECLLANMASHAPGLFYQFRLAADGSSRFPYVSAGIGAIYELTAEAVRQDAGAVFARLHREDMDSVRAAIDHSAQTLTPWAQQYRVVLPERGERWLDSHATPEKLDDGSLLWSGFIQDITDRRAAEQVVRENFVHERESRAKSAFLLKVSHELRTPLNAVLGFASLIQNADELTPRTRNQIERVREAGLHLLSLTDDLLDLGHIERGHPRLHCEALSVGTVVAHQLALIEPLAAERHIQLMPVLGNLEAQAQADARALGQVLLNLLSNGVKYNRDGGRLQVEIRSTPGGVTIGVEDDGPGLTPSQHLALFQPFNRLGAENSATPGVGLGLVISQQLVEAMRGGLTVHNRPQGGCRFEVRLPASLQPAATVPGMPGPARPPPCTGREDAAEEQPLLLCVEDDPVNAQLMQAFIDRIGGCRLLLAEDGETALRLAQRHRPALLFSDIHMAKMDGLTLVARIRADAQLRGMRCIALTGDARPEDRLQALLAGFDDHQVKPLDLAWLEPEVLAMRKHRDTSGAGQPGCFTPPARDGLRRLGLPKS